MKLSNRRRIERAITSRFIRDCIKAGYRIGVQDHNEVMREPDQNAREILALAMDLDEVHLAIHEPDSKSTLPFGWAFFVYGNDGWDALCDYTCNLEDLGLIQRTEALAEQFS